MWYNITLIAGEQIVQSEYFHFPVDYLEDWERLGGNPTQWRRNG